MGIFLRSLLLLPAGILNNTYAQTPAEAYAYITNPFVQPNDSTLNWYGSGDANNDNIIDQQDISRLEQVGSGIYNDPADSRLKDRCDVDGDGLINDQDKSILQNYINGILPYLPGHWNRLQTRAEKEDWLQKMLVIDRSDSACYTSGHKILECGCHEYSAQALINFNGYPEDDLYEFLRTYPYDTLNNGRFNLPLLRVTTLPYAVSQTYWGHVLNAVLIGDSATRWLDFLNIEAQLDTMNIQVGDKCLFIGELNNGVIIDSLLVVFEGSPVDHYAYDYPVAPLSVQIGFFVDIDKNPAFKRIYISHPEIKLIMARDYDRPDISLHSPVDGGLYSTSPRMVAHIKDSTIFDRFSWKDGITGGEKLYYNPYIWYSFDNGTTRNSMFKDTDIDLNLPSGNYNLMVHAVDEFGNESTKTISFMVDYSLSVTDVSDNTVFISPNPIKDIGRFTYPSGSSIHIELYNGSGAMVQSIKDQDQNGETQMDLSNLNSGLYLYRIIYKDGKVLRGKVMRE